MDLYKYYTLYQKQGRNKLFQRLVGKQFELYNEAALEYLVAAIGDELSWRVGPKADYLKEILWIALTLLLKKRHRGAKGNR